MRVFSCCLTVAAAVLTGLAQAAWAEEVRSTLEDQTSVAVTIYNENLALIKDTRSVRLPPGLNQLAMRGVSARLRAETALLRNLDSPKSLSILEQNFDYDLLTPAKLLEKYVGKQVQIATMNPATGAETVETATILSTNAGVVVRIGDRIEVNPAGRFIFSDVPDNLRDVPTLSIMLDNKARAAQRYELSYLSGGLSWKADYVAELNAADDKLDLTGWVTLDNRSGTTYRQAKMQLVAGDVNQVQTQLEEMVMRRDKVAMAAAAPSMSEEALFEYHLYTLNRPTTIADNQTKQVSLLSASGVPVRKELVLQGNNYYYGSSYGDIGQKMKLGVFVQFENEKKDGLGIPLPKGIVRVYKRDSAGNAQFVGEDRIDHTPNRESVRLKLGDAFDVTANKKQTDFTALRRDSFQSSFAIELNNGKSEPVDVVVREPIPGDWRMVAESAPHEKVAAGTAEWRLKIPAEASTTLTYTVRVDF